jgi:hypothetical protein
MCVRMCVYVWVCVTEFNKRDRLGHKLSTFCTQLIILRQISSVLNGQLHRINAAALNAGKSYGIETGRFAAHSKNTAVFSLTPP